MKDHQWMQYVISMVVITAVVVVAVVAVVYKNECCYLLLLPLGKEMWMVY
jgi:hypothetical protein